MLKKCIVLVTAIFLISVVSGYLYANLNPYESARVMQELSDDLGWITDLDPVLILFAIFLNNSVKSFIVILLGALGIVPIILLNLNNVSKGFFVRSFFVLPMILPIMFIMLNGYILGIVMCESARAEGLLCVAAAILPHGIIELPMVLLSAALGTRIGAMVLLRISGKISTEEIISTIKWSISFYFRWILPLLFVAAVIETFITPAVLWILG
ncbi:MAG: stage II sporulation protein M [Euryarchaeota archaeon]|nr:stage II sporulation protein M [Euryarchaeota archaeon]